MQLTKLVPDQPTFPLTKFLQFSGYIVRMGKSFGKVRMLTSVSLLSPCSRKGRLHKNKWG